MKIKTGKDMACARKTMGIGIAEMIRLLNNMSRNTYNNWEREEFRGGELSPYIEPAVKWASLVKDMQCGDPQRIAANLVELANQNGVTREVLCEVARHIQDGQLEGMASPVIADEVQIE